MGWWPCGCCGPGNGYDTYYCDYCEYSEAPVCMRVNIEGITNGGFGFGNCYNGIFDLPFDEQTAEGCVWSCTESQVVLRIYRDSGDFIIEVEDSDGAKFTKNLGSYIPDCSAFAATELTYDTGGLCTSYSGATAKVTSLNAGDCRCCECCLSGTIPDSVQVTFEDVADSDCNECGDINGTHVLDFVEFSTDDRDEWETDCVSQLGDIEIIRWVCDVRYELELDGSPCGFEKIVVLGSECVVHVYLINSDANDTVLWRFGLGEDTPVDCSDFSFNTDDDNFQFVSCVNNCEFFGTPLATITVEAA